ncbi:KR domain-containing protein [Streptomyces sp. XD-27]|uniref:KR domain-containing protein n=1 Tax=Streptomyces sp. XD-27 TaxID=3062779 RepID=UPI0026F43088|nr:KR domain-containing protein [Streptomyces sp. XD-27]WKX69201.1 KR domain-containing protein [Streptomyces sp. XD-27]
MTTVLIIGAGDMGERVADGLAAGGRVRRVLVAGRSSAGDAVAATVASARDCLVEAVRLDASRPDEVANSRSSCPSCGPSAKPATPGRWRTCPSRT